MSMKHLIRVPKSDPKNSPFMVIWEVTQACDLVCKHCRASAQPESHPQALTFEQGCKLIDDVRAFSDRPPILVFTGGDPFKRNDLPELIAYASKVGLVPAVSPSATPLLNRENLIKIKEAGAKAVSLSLDASTQEAHDEFRGVEGSYQFTLDGWRAAQDVGLKVQVNTTVTRHNLDDLANIFALIQDLKVMTWSVFFLVPTGRGSTEEALAPEECEAVMNFLVDTGRYVGVKTTEGHHFKRITIQRSILPDAPPHPLYHKLKSQLDQIVKERNLQPRPKTKRPPMNINAGNGFVFVSHLGEVFPSGFLPVTAGNVKRDSLTDIYRHSPLFVQLRDPDELQGRCGRCEFRSVCAGSRSRAFATTGSVVGEDPFCGYEPGSFPAQEELKTLLQT
jgi:AdoMet-dependent heme synthase